MIENVSLEAVPAALLASIPRAPRSVSLLTLARDFRQGQGDIMRLLRRTYPQIAFIVHNRLGNGRHVSVAADSYAEAERLGNEYMDKVEAL